MRRAIIILVLFCMSALAPADDSAGSRDLRLQSTQVFNPAEFKVPAGNAGLFVGINRFTRDGGLTELSYAVHDAVELAYLLVEELKVIPAGHCYLLLSGEPSTNSVREHLEHLRTSGAHVLGADRSQILAAFLDVTDLASESSQVLICSFSSHGFEDAGRPYVMPSDGIRRLLAETAVPLDAIESNMQKSQAGHRLLLVDACQERVSAKAVGSVGQPTSEAFVKALQVPTGQAKFASCSPGEFSFEHGSLGGVGHGLFTYELLQAMRGGAKADADNVVRLGDVADYVATHVTEWTAANKRPKQTPFLQSPVETRRLPLAVVADEVTNVLAALSNSGQAQQLPAPLLADLRQQLAAIDPTNPADRTLLSTTREFLGGGMQAVVFRAYLEADRSRWKSDDGWESLFNGRNLDGWVLVGQGGFSVVDGVLVAKSSPDGPSWLRTAKKYSDFELSLEFRVGTAANSGVFLRTPETAPLIGAGMLEVQIQDDAAFPLETPKGRSGAIYNQVAPSVLPEIRVGEWYELRIRMEGRQIHVFLAGKQLVQAHVTAEAFPADGYLGLQQWRGQVDFRRLRIQTPKK